jgi:hypothetical protein
LLLERPTEAHHLLYDRWDTGLRSFAMNNKIIELLFRHHGITPFWWIAPNPIPII